jgi:hypothetical protein
MWHWGGFFSTYPCQVGPYTPLFVIEWGCVSLSYRLPGIIGRLYEDFLRILSGRSNFLVQIAYTVKKRECDGRGDQNQYHGQQHLYAHDFHKHLLYSLIS